MSKLDTKTSEVKDHAKFSASGSSRWLNCPGSLALTEKAPPQRESEYALEGTRAHACLEFILKNGSSKGAEKSARTSWPAEMVDHAMSAAHWINGRFDESKTAILLCETRVDASPFTCEGQFGTLDAALVEEFGRLTVIDYKYGAGVAVEPENNSQMIYYALALSHFYDHNFSEVELVIIQPRAYHHSGETIRSIVMPMDELLAWGPKFSAGVKAAESLSAPLAAGSWCKFCPAAIICPELKNKAMRSAQIAFSDVGGIESIPEPRLIPLPNLSTMLIAADRLKQWIDEVRAHALHVLERGGEVSGWKLVQKRTTRKWVDEDKATVEAYGKWGEKILTKPELLSPAQLEKVTKDKDWVDTRTSAESSGVTLVSADDKRPAVQPLKSVFAPVATALPAAVKPFPTELQGKLDRKRRAK